MLESWWGASRLARTGPVALLPSSAADTGVSGCASAAMAAPVSVPSRGMRACATVCAYPRMSSSSRTSISLATTVRADRLPRTEVLLLILRNSRPRVGVLLTAAFDLVGALLVGLIAWSTLHILGKDYASFEFIGVPGIATLPTWPFRALILIGVTVAQSTFSGDLSPDLALEVSPPTKSGMSGKMRSLEVLDTATRHLRDAREAAEDEAGRSGDDTGGPETDGPETDGGQP